MRYLLTAVFVFLAGLAFIATFTVHCIWFIATLMSVACALAAWLDTEAGEDRR